MSDDGKCTQCGTRLRGRDACPRGRQCEKDETEHYRMMRLVAASDKSSKSRGRRLTQLSQGVEGGYR